MSPSQSHSRPEAKRFEGREMIAWVLAALGIAALVTVFVTVLPTSTQNARARFFNGAPTPAMVQVKANPKKDQSGTDDALIAASVPANGGHVEGLANDKDYERFDVSVTVGETAQTKAYTIDDISGATKLSDIQLFRQANGSTVAVVRYSTVTATPYHTTGVVVLAFP